MRKIDEEKHVTNKWLAEKGGVAEDVTSRVPNVAKQPKFRPPNPKGDRMSASCVSALWEWPNKKEAEYVPFTLRRYLDAENPPPPSRYEVDSLCTAWGGGRGGGWSLHMIMIIKLTKYRIQNKEYGIQNTEYIIQNTEYRNTIYRIQNTDYKQNSCT
jgi:hypothetical protein